MSSYRMVAMGVLASLMSLTLVACGQSEDSPDPVSTDRATSDAPEPTSPPTAADPATQALARDADLRTDELPISAQEAIDIATDKVGATKIVHSVEIDWSDRHQTWKWEIEILKGDTDHEVEIDANTGEIISHDQDTSDDQEQAIDLENPLTQPEALRLATDRVDGALKGWKLTWDDGRIEYEFDLVDPARGADKTVDVKVDVKTKKVRVDG